MLKVPPEEVRLSELSLVADPETERLKRPPIVIVIFVVRSDGLLFADRRMSRLLYCSLGYLHGHSGRFDHVRVACYWTTNISDPL